MEAQINQHRPNISVVASAPGKVILHGEHSVVYGKLAVAASLGLRTTLTLTESSDDNLDLNFTDLKLQITFNIKEFQEILNSNGLPLNAEYDFQHPENVNQTVILNRIDTFLSGKLSQLNETHKQTLSTFLFLYTAIILPSKLNLRGMTIVIKSNLHLNSGMGSSASFAVTITAALYQYLKLRFSCDRTDKVPKSYFLLTLNKNKTFSNEELKAISAWAFFAEKIIHGNPSGIDNSTCTYGSIVEFRKGTEPRPLHLKHKLSAILIDTGVPKNTKVLVERAARKKSLFPEIIGNTLDSMEVVSVKAIECLKTLSELTEKTTEDVQNELEKEYETLGQLIDMNQNMLRILGASHPSIDEICLILESQGFHGKITGAGGGGFVLAVVPFRANEEALKCVQESLTNKKYDCWVLELGGAGVMIH